jgi:hypothetical protein
MTAAGDDVMTAVIAVAAIKITSLFFIDGLVVAKAVTSFQGGHQGFPVALSFIVCKKSRPSGLPERFFSHGHL